MYYVKERAFAICQELNRLYKRGGGYLGGLSWREGFFLTPEEAMGGAFEPFGEGGGWAGECRSHAWFHADFAVPGEMAGKRLAFEFDTQENGWDATNPQFLLFIDGVAVQGLDTNHRDAIVAEKAEEGRVYKVDLQAYSGDCKNLRLRAKYFEFNADVAGLCLDIFTAAQTLAQLDKHAMAYAALEKAVTETINLIDLRDGASDEFLSSVKAARQYFDAEVYQKGAGLGSGATVTAIGHTHIDVAWQWTVEQSREKAPRSFATAVKFIEEYGEEGFKFMSSQPQLYQFVKDRCPGLYEKIKALIKEGKWEAEGGMWLEADCNLISGESMARQFLHGKKFFMEEFGIDSVILWLPDVFGYSAALPQIMKESGVKYFMTTKIAWNQFNKFPYDTFMWRGIDGTEILTHLITTPDAEQDYEKSHFTTYNGTLCPNAVIGAWRRYQQKGVNNDVLVSFGHGDGGGGATREMIEQGIRFKKGIGLGGAPKVRFETSRVFFDELCERVKGNKYLPAWSGELYLEYHRGTYTSMARNKRGNRKLEFLLSEAEFLSAWAEFSGVEYPQCQLKKLWENLLLNQFHDILPGSSIKEVYDVTDVEYADMVKQAEKIIVRGIDAVAPVKPNAVTAVNTLHFGCGGIIEFDAENPPAALTCGSESYPVQKSADGRCIAYAGGVPAKGYRQFDFSGGPENAPNPFVIAEGGIETPCLSVKWGADGELSSVYDKEARREVLKGAGNSLVVYEDRPMAFDNWDIDIYYEEKSWPTNDGVAMEWIEKGPVRAALSVERRFRQSVIRQKIYFYAVGKRIDFETFVDWKENHCLLKAEFDVGVNASEATYDIQFGNIKRPTHRNTSWDVARFESVGHKYADLSEGGYGAALLNDCKYGYGIHDGKMTLSLIKSGTSPNPVADQGEHRFVYAFLPHIGGFYEGGVIEAGYQLNVPLRSATGRNDGLAAEAQKCFASIGAPNVAIETIKKPYGGGGLVIRMIEQCNRRADAGLAFFKPVKAAYASNIMEERGEPLPVEGGKVVLSFRPFEIKTIEVEF